MGDRKAAMEIVNRVGGVSAMSKIPEDKFAAVIRAANARAVRSEKPRGEHPATKASRSVNEESVRFWQDRKAAREAGEPAPQIPSDPGGHNERQLEKLSREAGEFREFVGGATKDV
jgi:hypothetical protein